MASILRKIIQNSTIEHSVLFYVVFVIKVYSSASSVQDLAQRQQMKRLATSQNLTQDLLTHSSLNPHDALEGKFDNSSTQAKKKKRFHLNKTYIYIYIKP